MRRAILTPANVHESVVADVLPIGDEAAVCAGKGCDSGARHARLAGRAVFDGIMRRGHRHRPLTPDEVARNRSLVPIRAGIERTYGTLKRRYGWVRVRYRGLASNAAHLDLLCLALNLRRLDVLTRRDGRGSPPRLRTASWWPRADVSPCFSSTGCWNPDHRRGTGDEAKQVCRRADHRGAARA